MYKNTPPPKSKICLALSGGIDSTFAGWLLKQEGYELTGAYLNIIDNDKNLANVKSTADFLGIPLEIMDLRQQFNNLIIKPFIKDYLSGQTPNPCVFCNAIIKCGILLDWALKNGFSYLATGHYAQIKRDPETEKFLLLRGKDLQKDQSYFLYRLTQKQLSHLHLPLDHWTKREVEDQIKKTGFTHNKIQESQEICFLSTKDYRIFLKEVAPDAFSPGPIYDKSGNRLGSHSGLVNYTIGQRKGLQLVKQGPNYVLSLDPKKNSVIVGTDEDLWQSMLFANNINRIIPEWPRKVMAKIRSTQPAKEATLEETGDPQVVKVLFSNPVRAITPGQSVVFYEEEICLGGGIIYRAG
ncbi:MAG: tRNA 2-thiouridine(34) synthase MnmA [bacterium]